MANTFIPTIGTTAYPYVVMAEEPVAVAAVSAWAARRSC